MLFVAQQDRTEVVVVWKPGNRCTVLVDGHLAARTRKSARSGGLSKGPALEHLDLGWLDAAVRSLLEGTLGLITALTGGGDEVESDSAVRSPMSSVERQLQDGPPLRGRRASRGRTIAGVLCPLCGCPMILSLPQRIDGALLCPLCYRAQHASAALLLRSITARMREALEAGDDSLPVGPQSLLVAGLEQLERVERALGTLGAED